jgi:5-carboxymethyl-2-hydroxymuconate isomerase
MPHIILEYSANVVLPDVSQLFSQCHDILSKHLPTKVTACRSRAIRLEQTYLGDGHTPPGFVLVTVRLLAGRSKAVLDTTGEALLAFLTSLFKAQDLSLSIEFVEMTHYYRNK